MQNVPRLSMAALCLILFVSSPLHASDISITGVVTDHKGTPVEGVTVGLKRNNTITTLTISDGTYSLTGQAGILMPLHQDVSGNFFSIQGNMAFITITKQPQHVTLSLYNVKGEQSRMLLDAVMSPGSHTVLLFDNSAASSLYFITLTVGERTAVFKKIHIRGNGLKHAVYSPVSGRNPAPANSVGSLSSDPVDTLLVSKAGYESQSRPISLYTGTHDFTIVPSELTFTSQSIPLSTETSLRVSHTSISRYGIRPSIATVANSDNSFDVALYISTTEQIQILSFNESLTKTDEITPASINGAKGLIGFTKIPDDGSFVVGYSKDNAFGDEAFEYWITRLSETGSEVFLKSIFGDISSDVVESEGEPGAAGSGRIVYNPTTTKIGFYCAHTRLWDDMVRHQGGHIGFMDLDGNFYTANSWFFSHNFDQRLIVVDSYYYTLAHGDAYPRALGFSKWSDEEPNGRRLFNEEYFQIPGAIGDNTTNTQTGGLICRPDGSFGVVFSSSIGRSNYDVCYMNLSDSGDIQHTVWLTEYPSATNTIFPRIAPYGNCILIAWEEVTSNTPVVKTRIIDTDGTLLSSERTLENTELSPFYDLLTLPNGNIIWATLGNNTTLALWKISIYRN